MNETKIIPISTKLPRGAIAAYGRKFELSRQSIKYIADGKLDRPEIYALLLEEALKEQERRRQNDRLREINSQLAKTL